MKIRLLISLKVLLQDPSHSPSFINATAVSILRSGINCFYFLIYQSVVIYLLILIILWITLMKTYNTGFWYAHITYLYADPIMLIKGLEGKIISYIFRRISFAFYKGKISANIIWIILFFSNICPLSDIWDIWSQMAKLIILDYSLIPVVFMKPPKKTW